MAQIRNHGRILQKSQGLRPAEIPSDVQYHRQCYQQFTNKNSLSIPQKQSDKRKENLRAIMQQCTSYDTDESSKPKHSSSSSSSGILLPDACRFCDKTLKYKSRKSQPLRKCEVKKVRGKIERCAKEKSDYRIISLVSTHDLVVTEAKYHSSCYADSIRPKKIRKTSSINTEENQEYKRVEIEAFQLAVEHCYNSMSKSKVIKDLLEQREQSCYVAKTARFIHKEIEAMKDEMPWPPQPDNLNPDNFKMPKKLGEFLTTLITGKDDEDGISSRHARLRHSLGQDIV